MSQPSRIEVAAAPAGATRARRLLRRTWIGAAMVASVTGLLYLARDFPPAILIAAVLLAGWIGRELRRMGLMGRFSLAVFALVLAGQVEVLWRLSLGASLARIGEAAAQGVAIVLGGALLHLLVALAIGRGGRADWRFLCLSAWVALPLPWTQLVLVHFGLGSLAALVLLSKIGDIAGFYVGSMVGRRRPFPRISPGKTVAGCVASLAAATLAGLACQLTGLLPEPRLGLASGLLAGATINLAAQAGDLLESWLKRRVDVKDSGRLFGPAGGVLDALDSLLLTVPVCLATWPLLFR